VVTAWDIVSIKANRLTNIAHLKLRQIMPIKKLHKSWDYTSFNNVINGRAAFCTKMQSNMRTVLMADSHNRTACSDIPIDKSFLNCVVASNCAAGSADATPCTIKGILSNCPMRKAQEISI